jgi:hypothetical protein
VERRQAKEESSCASVRKGREGQGEVYKRERGRRRVRGVGVCVCVCV